MFTFLDPTTIDDRIAKGTITISTYSEGGIAVPDTVQISVTDNAKGQTMAQATLIITKQTLLDEIANRQAQIARMNSRIAAIQKIIDTNFPV